jgi:hypothetical protein
MEDKVKKTTGKAAVSRDEASEEPERVTTVTAKESKVTEKKKPKESTKGKTSTIEVLPDGTERKRTAYTEDISDFWNHKPTVKVGKFGNPNLHLVDYRGTLRWFSSRQVQISVRRSKEVIVDNRPAGTQDYISFPKYTELSVQAQGKCKGCS